MADLVPESEQQYGSILTVLGESAEQNGKMLKKPVVFTHIAFGDANDTYVQPDRKAQSLVNELYRIPVNSVDVLQATPDSVPILTVEALLPDDIHDVVIREFAAVATFNGQEYFHAIGNCARIYVPSPINNGQLNNPVSLEMTFVITSAEPIVEMNPNVITASRDWVVKNTQYLVPSFTQAKNLNIPSSAKSLKTLGYDQEGDGVSFEYFLAGTGSPGDTDNGGYFVDQSGRKWVLQFDDVIHIKAWGVNSARTADDNAARIRAALDFGGNGKHYDFGDKDYAFSEVKLDKTKATLRGSGTYDGELLIRHSAYLVTHDFDMDFDIHLSMKTTDNTKSAVKYHYCSKGKCVIDGDGYNIIHHGIHHSAELGPDWGQPVRRLKFGGAYRNVNYFIKGENSEDNNISFTMADITLLPSTEGTALISHVDIDTIDGFTCHSQVQFFPGFQTNNQTKKHNIILRKYTWANIADNKFFESGEEALLLIDGTRLILHDNQYAWPGQRKPCYAVVIDGLPIAGDYFSQSIIHDENVIRPSLGGVIIKAGSGRIKLHDVEAHYPGRNERYYGTTPIPDGDKYGIEVEDGTIDVKTHDNYVRRGKFLLSGGIGQSNTHLKNIEDINGDGSGVVSETVPRVLTLDYATNQVDVRRFSMVNMKQPTPTIIDDLENTDSESKLVIFRAYNGNTTFKHSSLLVLKGSKDVNVPDRGVITFLCMSDGSAVEQSRSFDV
ncbi:phage tail protein [Vibrio vulnificus]|uniref:Phage tail protein n=1 Tax=Vibrio vulnificus TaxID=672 RepID=A0AAW4HC79_VIBVL|nr:phage tail protein [Vibrio vulnificus]MBN8123163.1 phage tail protein [Vibrio vulnificus]